MTDPVRLLDAGDSITPDERRALASELGRASPPGAKHAVWGALAVKLAAAGTSAAATTAADVTSAAAGSVGTSATSTLTVLSLVKLGGIGLALGITVSTAAFVAERAAAPAPPAPPVVVGAASDVPVRAASANGERERGAPPLTETPPVTKAPPVTPSAERVLRERAPDSAAAPAIVASEMQRVARARAELRSGNAPEALRTLRALELDEPSGLLTQEREALLIEALSTSGEREAARRRAAAFLARYPRSPHATAVRRATE